MLRRNTLLLVGTSSSVIIGTTFIFIIASTNLGLTGFIPGLLMYIPGMLCIGVVVGFIATLTHSKGCVVILGAGIAALVGILPIATFIKHGLSPIIAYGLGIAIGIGSGGALILLTSLGAWIYGRKALEEK